MFSLVAEILTLIFHSRYDHCNFSHLDIKLNSSKANVSASHLNFWKFVDILNQEQSLNPPMANRFFQFFSKMGRAFFAN